MRTSDRKPKKDHIGLADVDNRETPKKTFGFYIKLGVVLVCLLVVLSEIVVSQRSGTSINMDILERMLDIATQQMEDDSSKDDE